MHKLFSTLLSRITSPWRQTSPGMGHEVVLYTRRGCHLCDEAGEGLQRVRQRYPFRLIVIDVDSDPDLVARYGNDVPIVMVNGKLRFRGAVNEVLLTRLLRAEAGRRAATNAP